MSPRFRSSLSAWVRSKLGSAERAVAPRLYEALRIGAGRIEAGERDRGKVGAAMAEPVIAEARFTLDYAEVRAADLQPIDPLRGELRLLIAARLGRARLIDNLGVRV